MACILIDGVIYAMKYCELDRREKMVAYDMAMATVSNVYRDNGWSVASLTFGIDVNDLMHERKYEYDTDEDNNLILIVA